ncbi:DUF3109 family protein [Leptospirillum ferrooxidans]|uniref:DUF3109 family protein n=1 Tax=Leptospirillum ferrooxidans (strain C2-3) TaxID=1162668 RepID=I0IPJ3_LEPFC|nr:DUF3109 family protein [Leptospirillum ferrooxidans]BAM07192.1 hypothetical protein LFE_1510 [Leptospirillum ferrooxidans C2-3]
MSNAAFIPFPSREIPYVRINGVLVDPQLWMTVYDCNVTTQNCHSMCCYRSNILAPGEADRIFPHMEGILPYMTPQKQKIFEKRGTFVADCRTQCPDGCELDGDEVLAMARAIDLESDYRCNEIVRQGGEGGEEMDSCIFLTKNDRMENVCSIHAYAIDQGMNWMALKPLDCVQYPLGVYNKDGETILRSQSTPYLSHLPCHDSGIGPLMYRSMEGTIRFLMGDDFFVALDHHVRSLGL